MPDDPSKSQRAQRQRPREARRYGVRRDREHEPDRPTLDRHWRDDRIVAVGRLVAARCGPGDNLMIIETVAKLWPEQFIDCQRQFGSLTQP